MNFFGTPYPRDRAVRNKMIPTGPGKRRNEWDPFKEFDDPFYDALDVENGGFSVAADEYASKLS